MEYLWGTGSDFGGRRAAAAAALLLINNAFLDMELPQMGMAQRGSEGLPCPWAVSIPVGSPPGAIPGYIGVQGAHLPCSAPWAWWVPPDTLRWMRGSGNRGFSSVLEEREMLWLQQQLLPPAPSPGQAQNPNLGFTKHAQDTPAVKMHWGAAAGTAAFS